MFVLQQNMSHCIVYTCSYEYYHYLNLVICTLSFTNNTDTKVTYGKMWWNLRRCCYIL